MATWWMRTWPDPAPADCAKGMPELVVGRFAAAGNSQRSIWSRAAV